MYTTPLMGFIDEACVVFDGEEENKFEHTEIHEKFKSSSSGSSRTFSPRWASRWTSSRR